MHLPAIVAASATSRFAVDGDHRAVSACPARTWCCGAGMQPASEDGGQQSVPRRVNSRNTVVPAGRH